MSNESDADVVAALWAEYKSNGTVDARERLILNYAPLVKFVAGRVASGLPQSVDQSDLVSYGIFGLIDAIDKFEPERGWKFETYAISRIKGAIIDELRSIDWVPRSVRTKAREVERAYSKLEGELHRTPEESEVAAEMGISQDDLATTLSQISYVGIVALDEVVGGAVVSHSRDFNLAREAVLGTKLAPSSVPSIASRPPPSQQSDAHSIIFAIWSAGPRSKPRSPGSAA